jgi:hypothetical protein
MKQNILKGIILIGAIALGSCSTQNKIASSQVPDDDVYYTKAKAGDQPVYAVRQDTYRNDNNGYNNDYQDDYYYYDSYSARLNRFYNYSPFLSSYYDDLYYGQYSPYYNNYAFGAGLGYGYYGGGYFGYNPFSYYGYGYNPYFGYSNYGYYGSTIGYGYSPYWGAVSYYNVARTYNNPRPYRGSGQASSVAGVAYGNRGVNGVSYSGRPSGAYVQRGTQAVGSPTINTARTYNNGNNGNAGRPVRQSEPRQQPQYQPQTQSAPPASSSGSSGASSSGGGGGGRPVRP